MVIHEADKKRFIVQFEDHVCELQYRELPDKVLEYYRTYVPEEARGHGLAQELADFALSYAKDNNYKVKPSCWFVDKYISRHSEFAGLRA